jgi:hypothetical protein
VHNLVMNGDFTTQLPLKNVDVLPFLVKKRWRLDGQQVVLLMNEEFGPCTV